MDQKKEEEPKEESIQDLNQEILGNTLHETCEKYHETIKKNINCIMDSRKITKVGEIINKQITNSFTNKDLYNFLLDIYRDRKKCFKINMGIGYILYNNLEEQYKYYYVSNNHLLFDTAKLISKRKDIDKLIKRIISKDIPTGIYLQRPDSHWSVAGLANLEMRVYYLAKPLG